MINESELSLLEDFAYGELEEQEFLNGYPVDIKGNKDYLIGLVLFAKKEKDGDNLELLLDVIAMLEMYEDFDSQSMYRELIRENWHRMHESLVDSLDKELPNEDTFIYVLGEILDYHADGIEDFMVPIWNKCLWSLLKIRSVKGIEVIKRFVDSDYEDLRETARKLVSKLEDE